MAQTRDGARKGAAKKAGMSVGEYIRRVDAGEKWCTTCRTWHRVSEFGKDASRWDGLAAGCRYGRNAKARAYHVWKTRAPRGGRRIPARDEDIKQAERRINYFVEAGLIDGPKSLPCSDCGHIWRPRGPCHEYHHHLGYAAKHHEDVIALCSKCHGARHANKD